MDEHGSRFAPPEHIDLDAAFHVYWRATSDLVAIVDEAGRILFVNPASVRVLGLTPEQCVGASLFDFVHSDDRAATRAAFTAGLGAPSGAAFLLENRVENRARQDIEVRQLHWTMAPHRDARRGTVHAIAHARDVTAQIDAARRVLASEARHRAVLLGLLDPIVVIDGQGIVRESGRSVEDLFGYRSDELIGKNISLLMPEPHRSAHDSYLANYRRTGHTGILNRTRLFEVCRKDGTTFECELSVSRVEIPGEPEPLFVGSFRDVTARRRAERALAEGEARLRAIFDQEFQFVGLLTLEGNVLEVNRTAMTGLETPREEITGKPFWETPWWSCSPERRERLRKAVASAAQGGLVRFEVEHVAEDGRRHWVDCSVKPVRAEDGTLLYLLAEGRDVTPLKVAHARELSMHSALVQIGESASLLAHEIKNPITAVNLALRAVADKLGEDEKTVLEDLATRLKKLERTMRRTLSFVRPLDLDLEVCDPGMLLADVAAAFEPELAGSAVKLEQVSEPDLRAVRVDVGLIEDVLGNLVHNALEALGGKGRVRLTARSEGDAVRFEVEDDGPGLQPSIRAELFKPFVTSKNGGTGLGLALARKVVLEHGGEIGTSKSSLGGACFWILLPCWVAGRRPVGAA